MTQKLVLSKGKDTVEIVSNMQGKMVFQFTEIVKFTRFHTKRISKNIQLFVKSSSSLSNWLGLLLDIKSKASPSKGQIK